jgi:hypothetical protein
MNEFRDPDLENLLGRAGGAFPDVNVAYSSVQGQVRQAKRRRFIVISGAACAVLFAATAFAASGTGGTRSLQPANHPIQLPAPDDSRLRPDTTTAMTEPAQSTTVLVTTVLVTTVPSTTSPVTTSPVSVVTPSAPTTTVRRSAPPATTPATQPTTATTEPTPSTVPPTTVPPTTVPPTTVAPTTTLGAVTEVFSGIGGTITVRMEAGTLTLVSYQAAGGFTATVVHGAGSKIDVNFESSTHLTKLDVDLIDGAMVPQIEELDA